MFPPLQLHHDCKYLGANERFHDVNFEVSETIDDLQEPSHLCAQQVGVLPAGTVKYFPSTQGGVLSIDRSRLFMAGRYVRLRIYESISSNVIHVQEIQVHGY